MRTISDIISLKMITHIGRIFYGIGIVALGVHQLIIKKFRSEILPPFPEWAHQYAVFPVLVGVALIFAGITISGLLKFKIIDTKRLCLYLGLCFLFSAIACHLPYILILSPYKATRLDVWFGVGEVLAYAGGAFVMAGTFSDNSLVKSEKSFLESLLEKIYSYGRIYYAILIILFGFSHFIFAKSVSTMVPKWIGAPMFWTYFVGVALIGSAIAITFRIWTKTVAFLLALMLFLFALLFHLPFAIANPYAGGGNEIVRGFIALLFCGIALIIAVSDSVKKVNVQEGR